MIINQNCLRRDFNMLNELIWSEKSIDLTISDSMLIIVKGSSYEIGGNLNKVKRVFNEVK